VAREDPVAPAVLGDLVDLEDLGDEVRLRRHHRQVVLVGPEGLVDQGGLSVLVDLSAFLLELESGKMVVRHLRRLHRGRLVVEVAAGHDAEVLNHSDWKNDLSCWDGHSESLDSALAKQRVIGWLGFEDWVAWPNSSVE
jgi:hypothetical protein